jgi:murein DD-endopeptidase MepM/ murein hydrolase activator NlpD
VKASGEGRVVYSGWARGYGKTIIIEHQKGMRTLYAHNSKLIVNTGDRVSKGDLIAKSGNTGNTTGPNVHFEVQVNGRPVDPLSYI